MRTLSIQSITRDRSIDEEGLLLIIRTVTMDRQCTTFILMKILRDLTSNTNSDVGIRAGASNLIANLVCHS